MRVVVTESFEFVSKSISWSLQIRSLIPVEPPDLHENLKCGLTVGPHFLPGLIACPGVMHKHRAACKCSTVDD